MRYRQLGRSGLTISVLGLGTVSFGRTCDEEQAQAVVDEAIDLGVTFIDTGASYPMGADGLSETILGKALRGRRDEVVLATKFGGPREVHPNQATGSRRYIRKAVEESLRRLQTDHIDLYMIHVPDAKTPIGETLGALNGLVDQGKVLYIGTSNFEAWRVVEAEWAARAYDLPSHFNFRTEPVQRLEPRTLVGRRPGAVNPSTRDWCRSVSSTTSGYSPGAHSEMAY